jgi:hypothetical protein
MHRIQFAAVLLIAISGVAGASTYVVPTTTLAAQTANNTSAADRFSNQSNGNSGANNVSKVDVHSLLYAGATTKVFAHLMLWFGQPGHANVGYSSTDPAQVQRQINDMVSRGIDGVVVDWYGPNNSIDQATQLVMSEAEKHPGFSFAIMIDAGAIQQNSCSGCSPQQRLINLLQYVEKKYFVSKAYFTIQGQPVVTNFNVDRSYSVDWDAVNAGISVHPRFLFQDNQGFTHAMSDGSYSWIIPASDYGASYLSGFYAAGQKFPNIETVGAAYKGFNDSLAPWNSGRVMSQQCGGTWLKTFSEVNGLYNAGKQLPYLQLVTWNDYEEATEIESGIDSCFSLTASVSGSSLQWGINGSENTVDHYNVYISSDGQNLMRLTEIQPGLHSVDLCAFPIPAGNYKLFVQAVGKPMLSNRMPGPVSYTSACSGASGTGTGSGSGGSGSGGGTSQNSSFTASPVSLTIPSGKSGQVTVTATQSASPSGSISLSCNYLPANLVCSFSPATIKPGSGTASSTLKISNSATKANNSSERTGGFLYASWIFSFGIAGFVFVGNFKNARRVLPAVLACALVGSVMLTASCGGGGKPSALTATGPNSYTISILGNSGPAQISTEVVVSVQ